MAEMAQCLPDVGFGPLAVHPGERGRKSRVRSSRDSGWGRSGYSAVRSERYRPVLIVGTAPVRFWQEGEEMGEGEKT